MLKILHLTKRFLGQAQTILDRDPDAVHFITHTLKGIENGSIPIPLIVAAYRVDIKHTDYYLLVSSDRDRTARTITIEVEQILEYGGHYGKGQKTF